jgi:glutamyl-tRNA reductase
VCSRPRRNQPEVSAAAPLDHAVFCLGVSHHGAPLELLERLTVPTEALARLLEPFTARDGDGKRLCEGVILSTCNRTEIYAARRTPIEPDGECPRFAGLPEGVVKLLSERSGRTPHELSSLLFRHDGWAAVEHLFRVVCGLDSLVVGESQIVGQVARAYADAQVSGTAGVVLSTLFQEAIRGGRKARARIGIGRNAVNVGSLAVSRAGELAGPVSEARVVVIGTGEIGRIVLHSLRAAGARQVEGMVGRG